MAFAYIGRDLSGLTKHLSKVRLLSLKGGERDSCGPHTSLVPERSVCHSFHLTSFFSTSFCPAEWDGMEGGMEPFLPSFTEWAKTPAEKKEIAFLSLFTQRTPHRLFYDAFAFPSRKCPFLRHDDLISSVCAI